MFHAIVVERIIYDENNPRVILSNCEVENRTLEIFFFKRCQF